MSERVWISWESHRRSTELARAFDCELCCFDYPDTNRPWRYLKSTWRTLGVIFGRRPRVVFVQSPSIVLTVLVALCRIVRGFVYVIDAHNAVPNYVTKNRQPQRALAAFALKRSDMVIVTNSELCAPIRALGGNPVLLPDKVPDIPVHPLPERFAGLRRPLVTLVSTFAWDEPIAEFLEAARESEHDFSVVVTGKRAKAGELLELEDERIRFADFLPESEFEGLIRHSDLIVDLTIDPHILVCGAYESIAVGVPAMLADSKVTRETFDRGCVYADDTIESIRRALGEFFSRTDRLHEEMQAFRPEFERRWEERFAAIERELTPGR